jgi:nucleotide-binding universal stress UspA family protein
MLFKRILITVDGSAISTHAAGVGLELAATIGAEVALVHVIGPAISDSSDIGIPAGEMMLSDEDEIAQVFAGLRGGPPVPAGATKLIRVGPPVAAITHAAQEWSADLIVVGSHGRSGVGRALLGSVAEGVARNSPCPVLIVRSQQ